MRSSAASQASTGVAAPERKRATSAVASRSGRSIAVTRGQLLPTAGAGDPSSCVDDAEIGLLPRLQTLQVDGGVLGEKCAGDALRNARQAELYAAEADGHDAHADLRAAGEIEHAAEPRRFAGMLLQQLEVRPEEGRGEHGVAG